MILQMDRRAFLGTLVGGLLVSLHQAKTNRIGVAVAVLICGFTGAASAQGRGAWVLWMQSTMGGRPEYSRIESFPRDMPGRPQVICARWARTFGENPDYRDKTFVCLPDTVDPRGPKRK